MQPIEMQLFSNRKGFSQIFFLFVKCTKIRQYFGKKYEPQRRLLSEIRDCKNRGYLNANKALCQNTYGQTTC